MKNKIATIDTSKSNTKNTMRLNKTFETGEKIKLQCSSNKELQKHILGSNNNYFSFQLLFGGFTQSTTKHFSASEHDINAVPIGYSDNSQIMY